MKKKLIVMAASMLAGVSLMAGPGTFNWPGSFNSNEIPCPVPGILYSNQERTTYIGEHTKLKDVEVLGPVKVTRSMHVVCMLVGWGDSPFYKMMEEAKKIYPEADEIVNIEIVVRTKNICVLYTKNDVTFMGTAIKYKK